MLLFGAATLLAGCGGSRNVATTAPQDAGWDVIDPVVEDASDQKTRELAGPVASPGTLEAEFIEGDIRLSFTEEVFGDYNSDLTISGMDVFPLAAHFGEHSGFGGQTPDDPGNDCIDGNRDGTLNGLDLFQISVNFGDKITGYEIFSDKLEDGTFDTLVTEEPIPAQSCYRLHVYMHEEADAPNWYVLRSYQDPWHVSSLPSTPVRGGLPDNDPPVWETTTGVQKLMPGEGVLDVYWNSATDAGWPPVSYRIYWDTRNPIPFDRDTHVKTVQTPEDGGDFDCSWRLTGLETPETYFVTVRARDGQPRPLEEENTVQLATTTVDQTPPVWTDTVGIQYAEGGSGSALVQWNAAEDAMSPPVRYEIYYDQRTPISFDEDTQVRVVDEPLPGADGYDFRWRVHWLEVPSQYNFAVRAIDSAPAPNRELNTQEIAVAPSSIGFWQEIIDGKNNESLDVGIFTSLACDPDTNLAIAYRDVTHSSLKLARQNGESWELTTVDSSANVGDYTSLVFDDESAMIAYRDVTNNCLKVAIQDGAGWDFEFPEDDLENYGSETNLAIAPDGFPVIAFNDEVHDRVKYAVRTQSGWSVETAHAAERTGRGASLAFTPAGLPGISFINSSERAVYLTEFNGSEWQSEFVNDSYQPDLDASLVYDGSGDPLILFRENELGGLVLARRNSGVWTFEVMHGTDPARYSSLILGPAGRPMFCFQETYNTDLRFRRWTGEIWEERIADNERLTGSFASLALDAEGRPAIAYHADTLEELRLARMH